MTQSITFTQGDKTWKKLRKRAREDLDAKEVHLDARLKSHSRTLKAFDIRVQEHEINELRVKKLIRDKKIGKDLDKLRKEDVKG